jgi:hypothetical protein
MQDPGFSLTAREHYRPTPWSLAFVANQFTSAAAFPRVFLAPRKSVRMERLRAGRRW